MVKFRAHLAELLAFAFDHFKVILYTLGSITYAKAVHEIFKATMPEIFAKHAFLRIIAQSVNSNSNTSGRFGVSQS